MIKNICASSGCSALTTNRYCDKHDVDRRREYDKARRNDPLRKFYNTALWRRLRTYVLGRDPLCQIARLCVERHGHPMPSMVVDHIVAVRAGGECFDAANLQGACVACHDWKTATQDSRFTGRHD